MTVSSALTDTQGPAPEGSVPFDSSAASAASTMGDYFNQVKKASDGAAKTEPESKDTAEPATGEAKTEPAAAEKPADDWSNGGTFKYANAEEAEKANREAARKITELSEKLAQLEKAKQDTRPAEKSDDRPTEKETDDFVPLTEEEMEILWDEDPKAARSYERKAHQRELAELKNGLGEIEQERRVAAEYQQLDQIMHTYDEKYGKGTAEALEKSLSDASYMETLFRETEAKTLIGPLVAAGDRLGTFRILMREAHLLNQRQADERRGKSLPSSTGSGATTTQVKRIDSMADAFKAARDEQKRR